MIRFFLVLVGCSAVGGPPAAEPQPAPAPTVAPAGSTLREAFPMPSGATRVPTDGFGDYLATLTVAGPSDPVRTHDGAVVGHHARVIELPMVAGDLQQCADSAMRLRAEYLKAQGKPISFHATSGDPIPWSRYKGGERAYATGNKLSWKRASAATWDQYLSAVFMWAGTWSLENYDTKAVTTPQAGDIMIRGGFPGHAVVLLDVAQQGDKTFALIGEGFMPAQQFHVELGPHAGWWRIDEGLKLDHWTLDAGSLRRWK